MLPVRLALLCCGDLTCLLWCAGVVCRQCRLFDNNGSPMPTNAEGVNMPSGVNILSTVGRLMHLHTHARIFVHTWRLMQRIITGPGFRANTHAMMGSIHVVSAVHNKYGHNLHTQISLCLCALHLCADTKASAPLILAQEAAGLLLPVLLCCACAVLTVSSTVVPCRGSFWMRSRV